MGVSIERILHLDDIYSAEFSYSLPRSELDKYLAGTAFDNKKPYTEAEFQNLCQDIYTLYNRIVPIAAVPMEQPEAVLTAGGPGVGKTLLLRQHVEELKYPYICPDDICLKAMSETFLRDIQNCDGSRDARQALYNKWRPSSNAITHIVLAHLIKEKLPFCFGTTSSSPFTYKLLDLLVKQGYKITFVHLSSPNDICWESLKKRDQTFIQTTETDIAEKALLVPQRVNDTFLKYATTIKFYYRDAVDKDAELAATWIRKDSATVGTAPTGDLLGTLTVIDPSCYENIKRIHNAVAAQLCKPELAWEESVERSSEILTMKEAVSV